MAHPKAKPSESSSALSLKLEKRLTAYAMAAGAAAVGLLATASPASADIIFTPAHIQFDTNSSIVIDINHDGFNDLSFRNVSSENIFLSVGGYHRDRILGGALGAADLPRGAAIGPAGKFFLDLNMAGISYKGTLLTGSWANVNNRYLGLRLDFNGQIHYGWTELSVRQEGPHVIGALLEGYAYDTVANQPIRAGQTGPNTFSSASTPEPGTLGLLALGSLGLGSWRRRKAAASSQ